MSYVDTSIDKTVALAHRHNKIRSELFLRALRKHHAQESVAPELLSELEPKPAPKDAVVFAPKYWFKIETDEACDEPILPRIEDIKRTVCEYFKISHVDLTSDRRMIECSRPRMIGMYLARQYTKKSLPEIARRFGRMDHSTTHSAVKRIKYLCQIDWRVAHDVAHLEEIFS